MRKEKKDNLPSYTSIKLSFKDFEVFIYEWANRAPTNLKIKHLCEY
jgi:hypothetical protein